MKPTKLNFLCAGIATLLMAPVLSGCGGGEEAQEPTITIKSGKSSNGGGGAAGGSPADGGSGEQAEGFGTLTGRVVYQGDPPDLPPLFTEGATGIRDGEVCAAHDMPNEKLVVGSDGGVANVFIYLQRTPAGTPEDSVPSEPAVFDQENCQFTPHALVLHANQSLKILSSDPIAHNTHIFSKQANPFNEVIDEGNEEGFTHTFGRSENEPIQVKCDFHSWMSAYMLPLDHPYGAVSEDDGTFTIENIPAGTHRFRVWHEGAEGNYLTRNLEVTIRPDETTEKTIDYPADSFTTAVQSGGKSIKLSSLRNAE